MSSKLQYQAFDLYRRLRVDCFYYREFSNHEPLLNRLRVLRAKAFERYQRRVMKNA